MNPTLLADISAAVRTAVAAHPPPHWSLQPQASAGPPEPSTNGRQPTNEECPGVEDHFTDTIVPATARLAKEASALDFHAAVAAAYAGPTQKEGVPERVWEGLRNLLAESYGETATPEQALQGALAYGIGYRRKLAAHPENAWDGEWPAARQDVVTVHRNHLPRIDRLVRHCVDAYDPLLPAQAEADDWRVLASFAALCYRRFIQPLPEDASNAARRASLHGLDLARGSLYHWVGAALVGHCGVSEAGALQTNGFVEGNFFAVAHKEGRLSRGDVANRWCPRCDAVRENLEPVTYATVRALAAAPEAAQCPLCREPLRIVERSELLAPGTHHELRVFWNCLSDTPGKKPSGHYVFGRSRPEKCPCAAGTPSTRASVLFVRDDGLLGDALSLMRQDLADQNTHESPEPHED